MTKSKREAEEHLLSALARSLALKLHRTIDLEDGSDSGYCLTDYICSLTLIPPGSSLVQIEAYLRDRSAADPAEDPLPELIRKLVRRK